MGALDGKIAVVTGGSTGIGFAIEERFASEGAEVVIAGRRQQRLEDAAARIGRGARGVVTDVGDDAQVKRLIDSVPRVDLLVTCAGGAVFGAVNAMGRSLSVELAPRGIRVNVLSPGLTRDTAIDWGVPQEQVGAFLDALVSKVPLKKPGTVRDMADAAYFLATCAYATGQVIDIAGGWTAGA
jgi:NAD(P)-dependent dehydrogenase (short-subunit alcohol dehydrogenase family)